MNSSGIYRLCKHCKLDRPIDDFNKAFGSGNHYGKCRTCRNSRVKERRMLPEMKDKRKIEARKRYVLNKEEILKNTSKYYFKNRKRRLQQSKEINRKLREDVLLIYGNKCVCCDESTFEFLTIDHVNNDGARHRKKVSSTKLYRELRTYGTVNPNYQLLCWNCNITKAKYKKCPHVNGVSF